MLKTYVIYKVDWSEGWATPWGSFDASRKAPSRSGNQPHVMTMSLFNTYKNIMEGEFTIGDENFVDRR